TTLFFYSGIAGGNIRGNYQRFFGETTSCVDFNSKYKEIIESYGELKEQEEELLVPIPGIRVFYPSKGIGFYFVKSTQEIVYIWVNEVFTSDWLLEQR
ncbi:MAG: hypothetical protein WA865_17775, partial [Spirulinaceae cyanobacterium]